MKIIGMGRPKCGKGATGLCPGRCRETMGMNDTADFFEGAVKRQMRGRVRTGSQLALDDLAGVQCYHDHVRDLEPFIGDT